MPLGLGRGPQNLELGEFRRLHRPIAPVFWPPRRGLCCGFVKWQRQLANWSVIFGKDHRTSIGFGPFCQRTTQSADTVAGRYRAQVLESLRSTTPEPVDQATRKRACDLWRHRFSLSLKRYCTMSRGPNERHSTAAGHSWHGQSASCSLPVKTTLSPSIDRYHRPQGQATGLPGGL